MTTYTHFDIIADEILHILEHYDWSYLIYGGRHNQYYSRQYSLIGPTTCIGIVIKNIRDEDRLILTLQGKDGKEVDTSMFSVELWHYLGD